MKELLIELQEIRDQLFDFPANAKGKSHKDLILELTKTIEKMRASYNENRNIPDVLAPEDLPDDEDL